MPFCPIIQEGKIKLYEPRFFPRLTFPLPAAAAAPQGRLWPRHEEDRKAFAAAGFDPARVLTTNDLCSGQEVRRAPHHCRCGGKRWPSGRHLPMRKN